LDHLVTDLEPGISYSFKVSATNFNGEGALSDVLIVPACIAPTGVQAPTLVSTTTGTVELRWQAPTSDGGCPI